MTTSTPAMMLTDEGVVVPRPRAPRRPAPGGTSPPDGQLGLEWSPAAAAKAGARQPAVAAAGSGPRSRPPGPRRPAPRRPGAAAPTPRSAMGLLRQAGEGLADARERPEPLLRYPAAYLAALRAAAAVLAVRAVPQARRGPARNVWQLLAEVAPELGEWAAFFASCSRTRAAAEAGIARLVGQRDADDLLRQSEQFVELVERSVAPG